MNFNLKNWELKFPRQLKNNFAALALAAMIFFLPSPETAAPPVPAPPPKLRPTGIFLPPAEKYPVNQTAVRAPGVSAQGIYIADVKSMTPIYQKNPDYQLRPASTTKIMTALVAMEAFRENDVVTAKNESAVGKTIRLKSGEQISFPDMLYALLLESGNDAALALADNYPGGYQSFIQQMNERAQELGMKNTAYKNVSGVDQYQHLTTARDIAILSSTAMQDKLFAQIVNTGEKDITSLDNKIIHKLTNTNKLLSSVAGVAGIKTGWTTLAGECLITYVERGGRKVIIAMLNSADRFGETEKLINWVFTNHVWEQIEF